MLRKATLIFAAVLLLGLVVWRGFQSVDFVRNKVTADQDEATSVGDTTQAGNAPKSTESVSSIQFIAVLPPVDHDQLPLFRSTTTEVEALSELNATWDAAQVIRPSEPFYEYEATISRRMATEVLTRWPRSTARSSVAEIKLLAGERLPGIERGKELWTYARYQAMWAGKRADDYDAIMQRVRDHIRRLRSMRQSDLISEYLQQILPSAAGTPAESMLSLEAGIDLYEHKQFPLARDAFVLAANTGTGRTRRDALTWLLAVANQWLWYNDMLDAANGLLAETDLSDGERARALYSRAQANQKKWIPEKALEDAREVLARHADTQYASPAKELIRQVEEKLKKEADDRKKEQALIDAASPPKAK